MDETFPTPPPYVSPGHDVRLYQVHSPFSYPPQQPPSSSFSAELGSTNQTHTPLPVSATPVYTARPRFVSYETELYRSPALTTCPSCRTQVTSQVTFQVGTYAWLMCLVFVLCGLVLGCCLIPFFVNHFKDACHTCPHCHQVIHVQKKTCCR